ncbi:MAG: hypothetical protein ACI4CY_04705 [Candidatus Gastranaerophilaceae bacterium]
MSVNNVNSSGHTVLYTGGAALAGGAIGAASAGLLTLVICQLTGKSADRV